jgi:hypothetical protein
MENEDTANGERRKAIERGLKRIQNERITRGGGQIENHLCTCRNQNTLGISFLVLILTEMTVCYSF